MSFFRINSEFDYPVYIDTHERIKQFVTYLIMIMIIVIHIRDALQIIAKNRQQIPNLRLPSRKLEDQCGT